MLEKLFQDWHQYFAANGSKLVKHAADDMVFDGFYPHYLSQKKRVLFIGRESRDLSCCNYLDVLSEAYRATKLIYDRQLDEHA